MKLYRCLLILMCVVAFNAHQASGQGCAAFGGILMTTPNSLNFGNVPLGSSASMILKIQNGLVPPGPFEIQGITPLDSQFTVKLPNNLPFCVQPGETFKIEVIFTPTRSRKTNSGLKFVTAAPTSPDMVPVSGAGTGSAGGLEVSPDSLDFGEVLVGQNLKKTFNILNQGNSAATVDQVSSSNGAFLVTTAFPKSIPPGGQTPVNVKFTPGGPGAENGTLSVKSGGQTVGTVAVSGSGKGGNPDIAASPKQIDFGTMDIGTYREKLLGVSNTGDADLHVELVPGTHVIVAPPGPLTIGPGKSTQLKVRFIADAAGPISKTLRMESNDPDESPVDVILTGNGTPGKLGLLETTEKSKLGNNSNDTSGVQWVDYNGDGKEDIYLTGHNGNALFKNLGGGKFSNVTLQSKLGNSGKDARGASWADVDNDGDLDLFISNFDGPSAVLKNNKGVFSNQGGALGLFAADNTPASQGGIWIDFNNDGRLDLFVVKDGKPNQLFKQTGIFHFVDVAGAAGIASNSAGKAAVAADFNNDGYQDLYVANSNRPNKLYVNNKNETFKDLTQSAGVGFSGASEQVTVSDYDGDGDLDLFVANGDGSSLLYRNDGNLKFQNATNLAGLTGPKSATGASFADFDNDGDEDLLIVQAPGENVLFKNNGKGKFVKAANVDVTNPANASSSTTGDSNNDGTPDVAVGGDGGDSTYENTGGEGNNWLVLVLQGTASNRSAIGAKVILRAGPTVQAKVVTGGDGQSQDSLPLEFGLGAATSAQLIVSWPSGKVQTMNVSQVNQKLKITEPVN